MRKREKPVFARFRKQVMYLKLVNNINAHKVNILFQALQFAKEKIKRLEAKHGL